MLLGFGLGVTFQAGRNSGRFDAPPAPVRQAETKNVAPVDVAPADVAPAKVAPVNASPEPAVAPPPTKATATAPAAAATPAPAAENVAPPAAPAAEIPQPPPLVRYAYVYRYEKGGSFGYETGSGKFDNVAAARTAIMAECQTKGRRNCKFNYAPVNNCIAIARPPFGPFRVSQVEPDETSASADALAQCEEEHYSGCRVAKVLCPQP